MGAWVCAPDGDVSQRGVVEGVAAPLSKSPSPVPAVPGMGLKPLVRTQLQAFVLYTVPPTTQMGHHTPVCPQHPHFPSGCYNSPGWPDQPRLKPTSKTRYTNANELCDASGSNLVIKIHLLPAHRLI